MGLRKMLKKIDKITSPYDETYLWDLATRKEKLTFRFLNFLALPLCLSILFIFSIIVLYFELEPIDLLPLTFLCLGIIIGSIIICAIPAERYERKLESKLLERSQMEEE